MLSQISCVFGHNTTIGFSVSIDIANSTVQHLKDAIAVKKGLPGTVELLLVRICSDDGGGMTLSQLMQHSDLLRAEAYEYNPENVEENVSMFKDGLGFCVKKDRFTFKAMSFMESLDVFLYCLAARQYHVLVLVLVPSSVDIITRNIGEIKSKNVQQSLETFSIVAKLIVEDSCVVNIMKQLDRIEKEQQKPTPFVFLEGSSGSGKTQTAFALIHALSLETRPCFYFVYSKVTETSQSIYQCFWNISALFSECVSKDFDNPRRPQSPSCSSLVLMELYIFGFVHLMLTQFLVTNTLESKPVEVKVVPLLGSKLQEYISSMKFVPTIIIDECNFGSGDDGRIRFQLVQNALRCLHVRLVLLGTDSRAADLFDSRGKSSRDGPKLNWCTVFAQFPKVNLPFLELEKYCVSESLTYIIANSRPWFAVLATEFLKKNVDTELSTAMVNKMIAHIYDTIITQKHIFQGINGRLGQLRMFLGTSLEELGGSALIHSHFAQLSAPAPVHLMTNGTLKETSLPWCPKVIFPNVTEDVLLFLCLMGTPESPAFALNGHEVPFYFYYESLVKDFSLRSKQIDLHNAGQNGNDGNELEVVLSICMCLASHCKGLGDGVPSVIFIQNVLCQLSDNIEFGPLINCVKDRAFDLLEESLKDFVVPFTSIGFDWPFQMRNGMGVFGRLDRAKNADGVDITSNFGLSGECKDYSSNVDLDIMINVLNRVPNDSTLHIVLVRSLQQVYFSEKTRKTFKTSVKANVQKKFCFLQVNALERPFIFKPIQGIESATHPAGVVLFIKRKK